MTKYELAGRICAMVTAKRLARIGEPFTDTDVNPLDNMPERDRQPWLDTAEAVIELEEGVHPIERLSELGRDWIRYTMMIADPNWRDEMRRTVVVELRAEVDKLAKECGLG